MIVGYGLDFCSQSHISMLGVKSVKVVKGKPNGGKYVSWCLVFMGNRVNSPHVGVKWRILYVT